MSVLDRIKEDSNPAIKLSQLREAALADEYGKELQQSLKKVA